MDTQTKAATAGNGHGSDGGTTGNTYCPPEDRATQRGAILDILKRRGSITTLEARRLGTMHPGGRVMELRRRGHRILTRRDLVQKCARYFLLRGTDHADKG